ncbi:MAG: GNAT family N-acetyltransferase [Chlorobi bacterium]|nr:GNAT family N-acetyltransferase [Chlorobiota bacterium]
MGIEIIHGIENIDIAKWTAFAEKHHYGSAFQTPLMYKVFEQTKNYEPLVFASVDSNGDLTGVISGVRICNGGGIFCRLSARVIVWGGPLVKEDDTEIVKILLKAFLEKAKKMSVYCEIRNLYSLPEYLKRVFVSVGLRYKQHLNVIVDVKEEESVLLKKMVSAKKRNIKKAKKSGLEFGEIRNESELKVGYEILNEVYKRTEVPFSDYSLFKAMYELLVPAGLCRIYKTSYNGQMTGIMAALIFNRRMYEWYVGSKREFYKLRPNDFLVWEVIKAAKEKGLEYFDFGGAGKPGKKYGVRNFKKGFGGNIEETGRYIIVNRKIPWMMGNVAIGIKKSLAGK